MINDGKTPKGMDGRMEFAFCESMACPIYKRMMDLSREMLAEARLVSEQTEDVYFRHCTRCDARKFYEWQKGHIPDIRVNTPPISFGPGEPDGDGTD